MNDFEMSRGSVKEPMSEKEMMFLTAMGSFCGLIVTLAGMSVVFVVLFVLAYI